MESKILYRVSIYIINYWCRIMSGNGSGKSGKDKAKDGPQLGVFGRAIAKEDSLTNQLKDKIKKIKLRIASTERELKKEKVTEEAKAKQRAIMNNLLDELRRLKDDQTTPSNVKESLTLDITNLESNIQLPNLRQQPLFPLQLEAQMDAVRVLREWEGVEPGVTLNALKGQQVARANLEACTTGEWSPMRIELRKMMGIRPGEDSTELSAARVKFAEALHMSMVPQFCGLQIPGMEAVQANNKKVRNLLECIAIVACEECQKDYNPLFVFAEAAFQNPKQFFRHVIGGGFAVGVLAELVGPTAIGIVNKTPGLAFSAAAHMVQNPLASFTTFHATKAYIEPLLEQVFSERFGPRGQRGQRDRDIRRLFDELSEYYQREGVTDIIGFPPADMGSMSNKVSQALHYIGSRVVVGAQSMGGMVESAMRFPGAVCSGVMRVGQSVKRWACDNAMRLLRKYDFTPAGIEEGMFVRILKCLDDKNLLEDPDINNYIIAFLKLNNPSTVFQQLVQRQIAEEEAQGIFIPKPSEITESLGADADPDSLPNRMNPEVVGPPEGSGELLNQGEIYAEMDMNDDNPDTGAFLQGFKRHTIPSLISASNTAEAARREEDEKAARLAAAQAGAQPGAARGGIVNPSGMDQGGGHSRSRKHSVSKRTRRKGVGKKQKSKKNKRQSRRKVRRASSRKLRK